MVQSDIFNKSWEDMEVILIDNLYGYCPGLTRSIEIANKLAETAKKEKCSVYCDVPLAHNAEVTAKLHRKGVILVDHIGQIKPKDDYFLVSAHGASHSRMGELSGRGFKVVDGVCPKVKAVQDRAVKDSKDGYDVIIFGIPNHAEVIGINGCINNQALIINTVKDAENIRLTKKTSLISQTTYPASDFNNLFEVLKRDNPNIEIVQRNTTCAIVNNRIKAVTEFIKENSINKLVVVGSPTSSNTKLLAVEASKIIPNIMVADYRSVHKKDIVGYNKVLVASGTSAPPEIVRKVADKIRSFT